MDLRSRRAKSYGRRTFRWARFKHFAKSQLNRLPLIGSVVIWMWRVSKLLLWRCKWKLTTSMRTLTGTYSREVDVDKLYWVSPQRIAYCSSREFKARRFKGHVIGGDWDRLEKKFQDLEVYNAFKQVCLEGRDWSKTIAYQRALDRLNRGQVVSGCRDKSDLDERCKDREALFHTIRREGYKSQRELSLSQQHYDPLQADEEVTVSIGRHGDLLFCDGGHRLAIAKLLGIQDIPIRLAVRHPEWMRFRKELLAYAKQQGGGIPEPITHPDLDDIPSFHECEDRFTMIKENMSAKQGRLLDLGANLGYYCHRFEDEGFDCYAVEDSQVHLYFLRKLKRAEQKRFRVIAESIWECRELRNTHFDVVLALNISPHFLKTRKTYDKFADLLKNLRMEELFFEVCRPDKPQMQGAYKNYSPDEFVEVVLRKTSLGKAECVGVPKGGGPLYRLS